MYQHLVPLRYAEHGLLRLTPPRDYGFARGELLAPIILDELADVARAYPIVFPRESSLPTALLGVEANANAYVGLDGRWLADYVPAYIRQYPFRLAKPPAPAPADAAASGGGAERLAIMVVADAPLLSYTSGEPIFDDQGQLSAAMQAVVKLLQRLYQRSAPTERLVTAIAQAGLLVERPVRIRPASGADQLIGGLRVVDEKKFNALGDEAFTALRRAGALPLIYAHLLSWANFRQGPIGRSHPLTAPAASFNLDDLGDRLIF